MPAQSKNNVSVLITLASPEVILKWSHGEVTKPETINYRAGKPEKGGLFCEKIFGPTKDYQCYCGKYKGVRYKGVVCDRCGVEATKSAVRRERMGHIELATPVAHTWFLRRVPYRMSTVLGISNRKLERVIYFAAYLIIKVDEQIKEKIAREIEAEFKEKAKEASGAELEELKEARRRAQQQLAGIEPLKVVSEKEYRLLAMKFGACFEARTGSEAVRRAMSEMDLVKEIKRLNEELQATGSSSLASKISERMRLLREMHESNIRPEWMFLTVLPVLPPGLRPMVQLDGGRYASSDINDLYRRVINRNNRLKHLMEIDTPEIIIRNEKRMLQEAVDALIDNSARTGAGGRRKLRSLTDNIQGKMGRFRRNLLGKRVDYSGRSVIAVGPELQITECGLPKKMALELFKPFVIKKLLDQEIAYNIRGASRLIEKGIPEVWSILEEVVRGKVVLLNRAPTLHRLGVQGFYPILIEGNAIKIHPLVCAAFNADFDGDQMAVHVPLSKQAQKEAREIMLSGQNLRKPATGLPIISPSQDIVFGVFYLTLMEEGLDEKKLKFFGSVNEALLAYQQRQIKIGTPIKVMMQLSTGQPMELLKTTVGRIIFNEGLPQKYPYLNKKVDSKALSRIINDIIEGYDPEEAQACLDRIKDLGYEYSTLAGISLGINDFIVPQEKGKILSEAERKIEDNAAKRHQGKMTAAEERRANIAQWQDCKNKIQEMIKVRTDKNNPILLMVESGSRGSWAQAVQMSGMKGLVSNPAGRIIDLPVKNSFKEGLNILEYFISTHGARKGTADKALRTAVAGYLTRRLVDVAHEVVIREKDCGDKEGLEVRRVEAEDLGQDFAFKLVGRYTLEDVVDPKTKAKIVKKGDIINWSQAREIDSLEINKVRVRSPLSCKSTGSICQRCYGWDLGRNELVKIGEAVGVVAAQSIGEPGTQLTMRTFHTGGVVESGDITQGLPRAEEILENRLPKGIAAVALREGQVTKIDRNQGVIQVAPIGKKTQSKEKSYRMLPHHKPLVKIGDKVKPGQPLTDGNLSLDLIWRYQGMLEAQRYVVQEIQKVYVSSGVNIHDKHIEVIARQMFSRVKVVESGDGPWIEDKIVDLLELEEVNQRLKREKKKLVKAERILLGISRVALNSSSFLSAASFQQTSQVLIEASLRGKRDKLRGLKENVIIGRVIPAGTGYRQED
ncbi:MAG TPA: DNA-directed RNA polymerase subunit beta' [Candidatus Pacearchaeota archaeon]|nr:DNA-directed RNA polymerase subunit beta' [Candidatus Pacearchaeota archaeon]